MPQKVHVADPCTISLYYSSTFKALVIKAGLLPFGITCLHDEMQSFFIEGLQFRIDSFWIKGWYISILNNYYCMENATLLHRNSTFHTGTNTKAKLCIKVYIFSNGWHLFHHISTLFRSTTNIKKRWKGTWNDLKGYRDWRYKQAMSKWKDGAWKVDNIDSFSPL